MSDSYLFLTKDIVTWRAGDESTAIKMKAFSRGDTILVRVDDGRNPQQHKKFFALLDATFENQAKYKSKKEMRSACLCEIGYCTIYELGDGVTYRMADSMSFAAMGRVKFNDLYEKALTWMSALIEVDVETLRREARA